MIIECAAETAAARGTKNNLLHAETMARLKFLYNQVFYLDKGERYTLHADAIISRLQCLH